MRTREVICIGVVLVWSLIMGLAHTASVLGFIIFVDTCDFYEHELQEVRDSSYDF